jgi:hypothetical protein
MSHWKKNEAKYGAPELILIIFNTMSSVTAGGTMFRRWVTYLSPTGHRSTSIVFLAGPEILLASISPHYVRQ